MTKLRKYGIQSSYLTVLNMHRMFLITKEKAKRIAEKKSKQGDHMLMWAHTGESINDDLDSLFYRFQKQEEIENEIVTSFIMPKLTTEELKLVEEYDPEHIKTFRWEELAYVVEAGPEAMKKSDSKDKYLQCLCKRRTMQLTLETNLRFLARDPETMKLTSKKRKMNI